MPPDPRAVRFRLLVALALAGVFAIALASAALFGGAGGSGARPGPGAQAALSAGSQFAGAELTSAPPAPDFTLSDTQGRSVRLASYRGRVVVLSFLYAACGPACTLIAQQIRGALDQLGRGVPVLFVSVAPAAERAPRVAAFLAGVSLGGRVRYLIGPRSALPAVWRAYGVRTPSGGRAAFEERATVLLIDRAGRERVAYQQGQLTPESLAHDIGRLEGG